VNASLRGMIGHPVVAATVSFAVGTIALLIAGVVTRVTWPSVGDASRVPWWAWTGGLLGAVFVAANVVLAPRLGAAVLTAAIVAGQLGAAIMLDHFGWIGFPRQPLSLARAAGALLMLGGLYLIQRK
jgi:transporter family-2 protein